MALFRNDSNIETVEKACPICHSDVKGNDTYLYFCQKCNILFKKEDLILAKEVVEDIAVKKIVEKFDKDREKIQIEEPRIKEKELSEKKQTLLDGMKKAKRYYISRKSNVLHVANCPYGKNIKKENKIVLKTLEGTEQLKRCKCLTDQ